MPIQSQGIITRDNVSIDVGRSTLDETLSETETINGAIREILDVATAEWGVVVTLVELKDIQLPESMKRAMPARPRPSARSAPRSSPPRARRPLPRHSATRRTR
jgi:regulator of protease activity HflC (stomatin/prohibitin superfamily)